MDWIREEVTQLEGFRQMFKLDKHALRKVTNQKVTSPNPDHSGFTTAITTEKQVYMKTEKELNPSEFVDVIKFDPEDYYDPDLWDELEKYKEDYEPLNYN